MGDERHQDWVRERKRTFGAAPDPAKAQAERRANVAQDIEDGLIADLPAARNTDPESSHEAAAFVRATGTKAAHQRLILETVRKLPGLMYREIAMQCGLERHAVARRLPELEAATQVRKGHARVIDGRSYSTWWPVESVRRSEVNS